MVGLTFGMLALAIESTGLASIFATLLSFCICKFAARITRPLRYAFPVGCKTVRDLAEHIATYKPHSLKEPERHWSRAEIAAVVRTSITKQLGVKDFSEDDEFIKDLGMA